MPCKDRESPEAGQQGLQQRPHVLRVPKEAAPPETDVAASCRHRSAASQEPPGPPHDPLVRPEWLLKLPRPRPWPQSPRPPRPSGLPRPYPACAPGCCPLPAKPPRPRPPKPSRPSDMLRPLKSPLSVSPLRPLKWPPRPGNMTRPEPRRASGLSRPPKSPPHPRPGNLPRPSGAPRPRLAKPPRPSGMPAKLSRPSGMPRPRPRPRPPLPSLSSPLLSGRAELMRSSRLAGWLAVVALEGRLCHGLDGPDPRCRRGGVPLRAAEAAGRPVPGRDSWPSSGPCSRLRFSLGSAPKWPPRCGVPRDPARSLGGGLQRRGGLRRRGLLGLRSGLRRRGLLGRRGGLRRRGLLARRAGLLSRRAPGLSLPGERRPSGAPPPLGRRAPPRGPGLGLRCGRGPLRSPGRPPGPGLRRRGRSGGARTALKPAAPASAWRSSILGGMGLVLRLAGRTAPPRPPRLPPGVWLVLVAVV